MEETLTGDIQRWSVSGAGGKEGGEAPTEDPDSLRSKAKASVLSLFSEGEIQGFPAEFSAVQRNERIYLNDTPLVGKDGKENFEGVGIVFATGTQEQASLPGFNEIRAEQSVGIKVTQNVGSVSATTTSADYDRLNVRIGVASLFKVEEDSGDVKGTKVEFNIQITDSLGTVVVDKNEKIKGKSRGPYDVEYNFVMSGIGPWTVKVKRLTKDPKNLKQNSDLYFKAIVGIIQETLRYPNSALMGFDVSAEFFDSVPAISAELLGLKIKVPSNYDSATNSYSGVWNGTFKTEYNNNPVWVFYDLLTNPRYGCGEFIDKEDIDIYSLLPVAQYCDEMVSDGKGGTEKRFEFNGYINNRGDAYEVLNSLAACFRGMIYYAQGLIVATQDRPASAVKQFAPSNVIVEVSEAGELTKPAFVYEGTGLKARKTVALVSWNDKNDRYRGKIEYVEDRDAIDRYGYRELEVRALGCTSQGQAQRVGRWALVTNLNETETVTFKVAAEGLFLMPGEVIEIADPYKSIGIYAGTLAAIGTSAAVLDRDVTLEAGKTYEIIIRTGDGIDLTANVANSAGSTNNISFSPSFTEEPELPAAWIIREAGAEPRKYRVIALNEDDQIVTVLASAYYEDKYSIVDDFTTLSPQTTSIAGLAVTPIVNAGSIILQAT
ncbi:MAG: host specificity protein J [Candidatus Nanopelagicaceae bacterium]